MNIKIIYKNGETQEFEEYTEIHYGYPSPLGLRIAFESSILHTGFTEDINDIKEVIIT